MRLGLAAALPSGLCVPPGRGSVLWPLPPRGCGRNPRPQGETTAAEAEVTEREVQAGGSGGQEGTWGRGKHGWTAGGAHMGNTGDGNEQAGKQEKENICLMLQIVSNLHVCVTFVLTQGLRSFDPTALTVCTSLAPRALHWFCVVQKLGVYPFFFLSSDHHPFYLLRFIFLLKIDA